MCVLSESVSMSGLYSVCVCVRTRDTASRFLGQTPSFCACHILLSVAHTPSLIPRIPLSPRTSVQTLINSISQNGIRFITPHHTQRRENTTTSAHAHTNTAVSGMVPNLRLKFLYRLYNILFCCCLPQLCFVVVSCEKIMLEV